MGIYLGIDIGTQSVKALCFDADRRRVAGVTSAPLQLISREDGSREQLAGWWLEGLGVCLAGIDPALRAGVSAIGVSGQQHGFVPLSAQGEVLAPVKLWCDTSTVAECEEIMRVFGGFERCISELGNPVLPGYTASRILWLKRRHPDLYARMATVLLPHDYVNFYLTGVRAMECGDASGTGLLDIRARTWHAGMLAAVDGDRDLGDCLPALVAPDEFIGELRPEVAGELGLPAGIPVSCGGGDNMMAAIGTGNVAPGRFTVSLGTSGTVFAYSETAIVDSGAALAAFCDSTGAWLPLLCTMNCTVATELTRRMLGLSLQEIEARVAAVPAGSGGILTLPFFQGERVPNLPAARGCLFGLDDDNYRAEYLLRSAMESAVYGLRLGVDRFAAAGMAVSELRLTGGGARSAAWRQMVADILGHPVAVQETDEGAALGAALQACWVDLAAQGGMPALRDLVDEVLGVDRSGGCEPRAQDVTAYAEHYRRYREHVAAIAPLYQ